MTIFILSKEAVNFDEMCRNMGMTAEQIEAKYPRRVILDCQAHGEVLGTIEADTWIKARAKVDESKFYHIENAGWFATNSKNAATAIGQIDMRQVECAE